MKLQSRETSAKFACHQTSQSSARFMQHFDANSDGRITREEFIENYEWVSASIDRALAAKYGRTVSPTKL